MYKNGKLGAKAEGNDGAPSTLVNIFVNLQKVPGGKKTSSSILYLEMVIFP